VPTITVPLVSVIVPTYNRADLVLRAVRTVLIQTERDLELLIVDDGSDDDTPTVLSTVDDPRVRTLRTTHVGVARARNAAIGEARGAWVAFLDDDNEWHPSYLERQLAAAAAAPGVVAVYCPAQHFDDDLDEFGGRSPWHTTAGDLFAPMMRRGYPRVSATMVRRTTLVEAGGFPPDLAVAADCELFLRVNLLGTYAWNPEALAIRHLHGRGHLSTQWVKQRESYWIQAARLRRPVVRRGGYRAWATWLRWHVGEAEYAVLRTTPITERRAAAWAAVRRLARLLPWSAPALARPLALVVLGPSTMTALRRWYRSAHRVLRNDPGVSRRRAHG
jgi:glycosyltransferase involved in cell wall biosynthesis